MPPSRNSFAFFYVRALLLLGFVCAWISCCVGCGVRPNPQTAHRALAAQREAETVALIALDDDGQHPHPFCAGVWISPSEFVTAGHCVDDLGKTPVRLAQEAVHEILGDDYPLEPWNPVGQPALFRDLGDEPDSFWTADAPEPLHLFARLALGDIADGDHVEIVGHPHGFVWSYVEGCVSSVLSSVPGAPTSGKVLQIEGAVSHGNSGGGAFNDAGRLVGVASFMVENLNGTGFFVHRDTVRDFLHRAGAA